MIKIAYTLLLIVMAILIFGAGVMTGITYEGHLSQWSKNLDLSDYISMTIITLLFIALLLSLKAKSGRVDLR
jgi:surface polysaccharide O-acyltransferase-like enzyme